MIREASNVEVFLHTNIPGAEVIDFTTYRWNMMGMGLSWVTERSIAGVLWSGGKSAVKRVIE